MDIRSKQNLIATISNGCERSLISPENPFSLDNPDLLAANGNKLYAVFIPTYRETEDADHLLRRLYLSQLSYGYKMKTILLVSEMRKSLDQAMNILQNSFDHLSGHNEDVVSYIKFDNSIKKRWKSFSEIQTRQYHSFRVCLELSAKMRRDVDAINEKIQSYQGEKVCYYSWSKEQNRSTSNILMVKNAFLSNVFRKDKMSFKTAFENLMTSVFMSNYVLDNGELYPTNMNGEMQLVNTDWTMFSEDHEPNAYNKMLSFIGTAPVRLSSEQDLENAFDNYVNIRRDVLRK